MFFTKIFSCFTTKNKLKPLPKVITEFIESEKHDKFIVNEQNFRMLIQLNKLVKLDKNGRIHFPDGQIVRLGKAPLFTHKENETASFHKGNILLPFLKDLNRIQFHNSQLAYICKHFNLENLPK